MSQKNPVKESKKKGSDRVGRGGKPFFVAENVRVAIRDADDPATSFGDDGFRLARTAKK